jgi:hypothetical protein
MGFASRVAPICQGVLTRICMPTTDDQWLHCVVDDQAWYLVAMIDTICVLVALICWVAV